LNVHLFGLQTAGATGFKARSIRPVGLCASVADEMTGAVSIATRESAIVEGESGEILLGSYRVSSWLGFEESLAKAFSAS
jgi:hypothetical protein